MIAAEGEVGDAVEARVADDELGILVGAAVMPDARRVAVAEEMAVRHVGPAARADEVDPSFEIRVGVVGETRVDVPEA